MKVQLHSGRNECWLSTCRRNPNSITNATARRNLVWREMTHGRPDADSDTLWLLLISGASSVSASAAEQERLFSTWSNLITSELIITENVIASHCREKWFCTWTVISAGIRLGEKMHRIQGSDAVISPRQHWREKCLWNNVLVCRKNDGAWSRHVVVSITLRQRLPVARINLDVASWPLRQRHMDVQTCHYKKSKAHLF